MDHDCPIWAQTIKTDRDRSIWARNLVNGLIFEVSALDWSITIRLRSFGPKLVNHGSISYFGPKLVNHGPFSYFRTQVGQTRSIDQILGLNLSITIRFLNFGFVYYSFPHF